MMTGRGTTRGTGAAGGPARHIPVLLPQVIEALDPGEGKTFVDGTFGAGGHARAILEAADCILLAIDRDPEAIAAGEALRQRFPERLRLAEGSFADMEALARANGIGAADGITLDLGVSSTQLDDPERGFSFQEDGPLDMRMSRRSGPSAADAVNTLAENDLARIIAGLGEERRARAIAKAVVMARQKAPIERTAALADIVGRVLGRRHDGKHPATRTFQALRLYVNGELDALARGLFASERLLREGGRLAVVTFHSLEDRIVKRFFASRSGQTARPSRHVPPAPGEEPEASFRMLHRKAVSPDEAEVAANPRARSAKLRAGERTAAEALGEDAAGLGVPSVRIS